MLAGYRSNNRSLDLEGTTSRKSEVCSDQPLLEISYMAAILILTTEEEELAMERSRWENGLCSS